MEDKNRNGSGKEDKKKETGRHFLCQLSFLWSKTKLLVAALPKLTYYASFSQTTLKHFRFPS
jgi:hypothetical protein